MANNSTRSFLVEGTASFASQGGPKTGCDIPNGATALAAVISAVNPTTQGYLKAYPYGTGQPASSVMDYSRTITTSSGVTVAMTANTLRGLTVYNFGGPTDVLIDITGYYQPQIEADIFGSGAFFGHSSRVLSVTHTAGTGLYTVAVDRLVEVACSAVATPVDAGNFANAVTETDLIAVQVWHLAGGTVVNGDDEFNLVVTC